MAVTLSPFSYSSLNSNSNTITKHTPKNFKSSNFILPLRYSSNTHSHSHSHSLFSFHPKRTSFRSSLKDDNETESSSTSSTTAVSVASEKPDTDSGNDDVPKTTDDEKEKDSEKQQQQQEMDWKTDEEFKKFMGNPSIEAAIKLEKKRADRKLKELDNESNNNPITGLFNSLVRDNLIREKERLQKAEETFRALDLNKVLEINNYIRESNGINKLGLAYEFS